jgi:hypothetical protein
VNIKMRYIIQRGSGGQRGHGIGSAFVKFLRFVKPYALSGVKAFGKSLLKSGVGVAKDVIVKKGRVGESLKRRASEVGEDLTEKLDKKVKEMTGGKKRKRRIKRLTPKRRRVSSTVARRRSGRRRKVRFPIGAGKRRGTRKVKRKRITRKKQDLFTAFANRRR